MHDAAVFQRIGGNLGIILSAMCFGGVMERAGMLGRIAESILSLARSRGSLVGATLGTCAGMNVLSADQYLAIVVPGRMFAQVYRDRGLAPQVLSRTLEDSGTVTSALVPWNTCGAYQSGVLGVPTFQYIPYAFLNYLNPIIAILMTYMGIGIAWRGKEGEPVLGGKTRPAELA